MVNHPAFGLFWLCHGLRSRIARYSRLIGVYQPNSFKLVLRPWQFHLGLGS